MASNTEVALESHLLEQNEDTKLKSTSKTPATRSSLKFSFDFSGLPEQIRLEILKISCHSTEPIQHGSSHNKNVRRDSST